MTQINLGNVMQSKMSKREKRNNARSYIYMESKNSNL